MKRVVVFILCSVFLISSAKAERLPRHLKTPKACEVVKVTGERREKVYTLICKKPLTKRMRGWLFFDKTWSKDRRYRTRVWYSRRGSWRLTEESRCRLRTCKAVSIVAYEIIGCKSLSSSNPFL